MNPFERFFAPKKKSLPYEDGTHEMPSVQEVIPEIGNKTPHPEVVRESLIKINEEIRRQEEGGQEEKPGIHNTDESIEKKKFH